MMIWAVVGIFLSIPFVPPNDSNQMRVYAATVTFLIVFSMFGLKALITRVSKKKMEALSDPKSDGKPALIFGVVLSMAAICGVLLVKASSQPQELPLAECPVGQTQFIIRILPGTFVRVGEVEKLELSNQASVSVENFSNQNEGYPEMHAALMEEEGEWAVLARPLDLISLQYPLLLMKKDTLPLTGGLMNICAVTPENNELSRRGWWEVKSGSVLRSVDND